MVEGLPSMVERDAICGRKGCHREPRRMPLVVERDAMEGWTHASETAGALEAGHAIQGESRPSSIDGIPSLPIATPYSKVMSA